MELTTPTYYQSSVTFNGLFKGSHLRRLRYRAPAPKQNQTDEFVRLTSKPKSFKIPYRLKSELQMYFHAPLRELRRFIEADSNNETRTRLIETLSRKKYSKLTPEEIRLGEANVDKYQALLREIDDSFSAVIPAMFSQRYYRGIDHVPKKLRELKVGDTYVDDCYSWFSPQKEYAELYLSNIDGKYCRNCAFIETVIPIGTRISRDTYGPCDISPFSTSIVTQRRTKYLVLQIETRGKVTYYKLKHLGQA